MMVGPTIFGIFETRYLRPCSLDNSEFRSVGKGQEKGKGRGISEVECRGRREADRPGLAKLFDE